MNNLWDYDKKELEKTEEGKMKILERTINFGVYLKDKEKIKVEEVKKYWNKMTYSSGQAHEVSVLCHSREPACRQAGTGIQSISTF